jgi:hypothetical protein
VDFGWQKGLDLLAEETMDTHRREALSKEYGEVCSNFRTLTDIRFKLLALLPIATAAATVFKGDSTGGGSSVFPLFGLIATIGLVTYNTRNDQLYDELVGRAASIERSLGLADGGFANRPHAWLSFRLLGIKWKVDHRTGIGTIYLASIAVWLFLFLGSLSAPLISALPPRAAVFAPLAAFSFAVIATWCARTWIKRKKKQVADEMRSLAAQAVQRALSTDLSRAAEDRELIELCSKLGHEKRQTIAGRAQFYAAVDQDCSSYYLPGVSKEQAACHLVALLADLPPGWLFDCATNRRGVMPKDSPVLLPPRAGGAGSSDI